MLAIEGVCEGVKVARLFSSYLLCLRSRLQLVLLCIYSLFTVVSLFFITRRYHVFTAPACKRFAGKQLLNRHKGGRMSVRTSRNCVCSQTPTAQPSALESGVRRVTWPLQRSPRIPGEFNPSNAEPVRRDVTESSQVVIKDREGVLLPCKSHLCLSQ